MTQAVLYNLLMWQEETICIALWREGKHRELSKDQMAELCFSIRKEINSTVTGNRNPKSPMSDVEAAAMYEATLLWALRKCGRPEVTPA